MLRKAVGIQADEIVLDLEDAVVTKAKREAREAVLGALGEPGWSGRTVAVRVNAARTPWCHEDLVALASLRDLPASVVLPKVESAGDVEFAERLLAGAEAVVERERPLGLQALIESAAGLNAVAEIARAGEGRLEALIVGYADLAASLGRSGQGAVNPGFWLSTQERVLVAARANGLQAIDGPFLGVAADEAFFLAARQARDLGFDGKWAIHPSQVGPLNELFAPTAEEVEWARSVLAALERAEAEGGGGAVALDGEMVDEALAVSARRLLARAGAGPG